MATIVNNSKYGTGHQVIIREKISPSVKDIFNANRYVPGKSTFTIVRKEITPKKIIRIGSGSDFVNLTDSLNNPVTIVGTASAINACFNHFTFNAKAFTTTLTKVRETTSMILFEEYFERGKVPTEDDILNTFTTVERENYSTTFYESSYRQLEELKKYVKEKDYTYERQGVGKTKLLYEKARKLSGLLNDNWNPADVWMIKKNIFKITDVIGETPDDIKIINQVIAKAFNDRTIIPISLKQVTSPRATSQIIDSNNSLESAEDLDMNFDRVDLSSSFNNFIIYTRSGFAVRVGYKGSSTTLNVSMEGRFAGAGYQLGAVDAKRYRQYCLDKYNYVLRSTSNVTEKDIAMAKNELEKIYQKYPRLSTTIDTYQTAVNLVDAGDDLTKKRFANLLSYLYSFLIAAERSFKEHMTYTYYSSTKQTKDSCMYLLLK